MPNGLLLGEDRKVAEWAYSTFKVYPMFYDRAVGIVSEDGNIHGAFLFQSFNGVNVDLSYYGPNTLTPGIVRAIAKMVLAEFNPARLTVVTSKRNKFIHKRSLERLGFKLEGTQRRFYGYEDTQRNTALRFVAFNEDIRKVAG